MSTSDQFVNLCIKVTDYRDLIFRELSFALQYNQSLYTKVIYWFMCLTLFHFKKKVSITFQGQTLKPRNFRFRRFVVVLK